MLREITIMMNGITAGLFGLASVLFLFMFRRNRLRVVLGVILAVYTVYFLKDILYMSTYVASHEYLYRMLLSIDNWAVPLYVIYAFEVLTPGRTTLLRMLLLFLPFPLMTVLYACWPEDWIFRMQVAFSSVFSGVCMCVVLWMTVRYRRCLKENRSDITHMDIRWMWVSIALFLPNLLLWTFLSARLDYVMDSVYYLTLTVSWSIVAYNTYYYIPLTQGELKPDGSGADGPWHFAGKLKELTAGEYFIHSAHLTLTDLAAELGTNRTTLSNYLNQELGTTFYDYVNSRRLLEAEHLLSDRSVHYSTEHLAELSGFNSLSTFRRAFFKKHGLSPQQYRTKLFT